MTELILGLDTSCYTTSLALVGEDGPVLDMRRALPVPPGGRGLRQAEAVFAHIMGFAQLVEALRDYPSPTAVAAAVRPRAPADSYLPVFRVGETLGRALAASLKVPFWPLSHQEGHLAAGWTEDMGDHLLAIHLSGGTTEFLRIDGFPGGRIVSLGTSLDLHAGQFLDRVGVAMGLPFPAGRALDELAALTKASGPGEEAPEEKAPEVFLPVRVRDYRPSFAGPEAAAYRLMAARIPPAQIARAALLCVARAVEKMVLQAARAGEPREVLVVGGVAASRVMRDRLYHRLEHPAVGVRLHLPPPELCTDNAVGVARWAWLAARKGLAFPSVE